MRPRKFCLYVFTLENGMSYSAKILIPPVEDATTHHSEISYKVNEGELVTVEVEKSAADYTIPDLNANDAVFVQHCDVDAAGNKSEPLTTTFTVVDVTPPLQRRGELGHEIIENVS